MTRGSRHPAPLPSLPPCSPVRRAMVWRDQSPVAREPFPTESLRPSGNSTDQSGRERSGRTMATKRGGESDDGTPPSPIALARRSRN